MAADGQLQQRLRGLFLEELEEGLELLVHGLLRLEREPEAVTTTAGMVQELFRTAHSLKGAAHAASVPEAVQVCDQLESALADMRDQSRAPDAAEVSRLLAHTDALAVLAAGLRDAAGPPVEAAPLPPAATGTPATPVQVTRTPPPPDAPATSMRVTSEKVDAVMRQAVEALAGARRLNDVATQAALVAGQVTAAGARARSHLGPTGPGTASSGLVSLLDDAARAVTALARTLEVAGREAHHTSSGVAAAVQLLRTQPFADACSSLDRVVRDVATSTGKSVRLQVSADQVDVDRAVVAALRDPLLHLVRNAVDHGIELPAVRERAGKPPVATVEVTAMTDGSLLHVTVRDDGAGIDTGRLREAAAARGLDLTVDDDELAFVPGLSSRSEVTAVSGRGVGLDAARARLEQLGGSLQVSSRPGAGTEVRLTSPVSLAVLRVLIVRAGEQVVAVPTSSVDRVLQVGRAALREVDGSTLLSLGDRSVRAVSLGDALGFRIGPTTGEHQVGVLVPREGDIVLVTDGLLDELEVAVHPVPARLAGATGVLGMTMVQGELPALVVNPIAVGRDTRDLRMAPEAAPDVAAVRILLAEDTVTTRALERSILEAAGYAVAVAVDGADAWQQLQADGADLVVSDVDMPQMSGIDLCRRIRSSPRLRDIPIVLVTSLDSEADRQRGLEAGADAYVVKSQLQQGSLLDAIARLL